MDVLDADLHGYAQSSTQRALFIFALLAGLSAVAGLTLWATARSISVPMAMQIAIAVADGDLTVEVQAHGNDGASQLLRARARMSRQLAQVVSDVRQISESVATASAQIAHLGSTVQATKSFCTLMKSRTWR